MRARWAKSRGESPMSKEVRQAKAMADDHCELWSVVAGEYTSPSTSLAKYFWQTGMLSANAEGIFCRFRHEKEALLAKCLQMGKLVLYYG